MNLDFFFQILISGTGLNSNKVPDDTIHAIQQGLCKE